MKGLIPLILAGLLHPVLGSAQGLDGYVLSAGDRLQLDFLEGEGESIVLDVGTGGAVQIPYLGTVEVAGLPLADVEQMLTRTYVDRQILIAPRIDLAVVNLRPFSVLGDVESPGFFDFRSEITVEQAVGLAGGRLRRVDGEEGRARQRVLLGADLAEIDSSTQREAVALARLRAQLDGSTDIDVADLDLSDVPQPDMRLIESLIVQDEEIILSERRHFAAEGALLDQAIEEARLQIELMEAQVVAQIGQIRTYDTELERTQELAERGVVAQPVRDRLLRQVADEEAALLRLRSGLASARRDLTGLRRDLLGLEYRRSQGLRLDLADAQLRAAQLRQRRGAVSAQLDLLRTWSDIAGPGTDVTLDFTLRRRQPDGGQRTFAAEATDRLLPGDVLIVDLRRTMPDRTEVALR